MDIKSLKFNSILDVANCFKDEKNIKPFLIKFFEQMYNVSKKSDGKFTAMIRIKKYYNVDYELLIVAFFEFLKLEGIGDLELAKVKVLLAKDSYDHLKNNLFFVHVLSYYDLVMPPKGSYFYLRALYFNSEKKNYFSFNSIGLSERRLGYYLSKEFLVDYIDPIIVNDEIATLAIGQKNVNIFLKENRVNERDVLKSQTFLV